MNIYIARGKAIIMLAMAFLLLALGLEIFITCGNVSLDELSTSYDKAVDVSLAIKEVDSNNKVLDTVFSKDVYNNLLMETNLKSVKEIKASKILTNEDIWHLPTKVGYITQYPSYGHVAYDITSPRGVMEDIYPVADGVISGLFRDPAGALIVTIYHNIDGVDYTSEYVHLSAYAEGIYVGKEVSVNDSIGRMGQTGYAYGVHLHFALIDCKLFDENDVNCKDINSFYNYGRRRYTEGFSGLNSLINVWPSWGV